MNKLPILMYHGVTDRLNAFEESFTTRPCEFASQMRFLAEHGYRSLTLRDVEATWSRGATLPERSVVITFDDAFDCLVDVALPIMQRHGHTATVFAIAGFLGRENSYDQGMGASSRRIVTREQLRTLHEAGIEIGSHTVGHPQLRRLHGDALRHEIGDSKTMLEQLLGVEVTSFAYPYGGFSRAARDEVERAGYRVAVSTMDGLAGARDDRFLLRRATIGAGFDESRFVGCLRHGGDPIEIVRTAAKRVVRTQLGRLQGIDPVDRMLGRLRSP